MKIHYSVWLSAVVLFMFSARMAWDMPVEFFKALAYTVVAASFLRVVYWFFEGE